MRGYDSWKLSTPPEYEDEVQDDAMEDNDRVVDFHLEEIDAWRNGERATPGCPATGERYKARMVDAVWRHELALMALGHRPTIEYVRIHGLADGARGKTK